MTERLKGLKSPTGNIITPAGRMSYPNLFYPTLPKGETEEKKRQYQVSMVFPKNADMALLNQAVEDAAIGEWGPDYKKKYKVHKPFLRTEEHPKVGVDAEEFPVLIRTSSRAYQKSGLKNAPPQIVRANKSLVTEAEAEEVYPGRWARLSLRAYPYDHPTGGKGISFGLQNVQLLDHDEPLAQARPAAEDEFDAAEVGGGDAAKSADSLFD